MATIILAGGLSARMGREKASLEIEGTTILQSLVSRFADVFGPVIVVLRSDQELDSWPAMLVRDIYQGAGPLGGLHAGLLASPDEDNFLLACDMPFADPEVARHLLARLEGHDAVVPALQRGLEPLHAAYRRSCVPQVEACLKEGAFRMKHLLDRINVLYLPEDDLRRLDPELRTFLNVNTPEDYDEVLRLLKRGCM